MKEVSYVRVFERTIWPTFKAEGCLSTQTACDLRDDLPSKSPRFDIRARPHRFGSGRLEIRDGNLQQVQEMTGRVDPSYLIPLFPWEQFLENMLGPRRVLLRYARMPPVQQVEFDGYDVPFASGCERVTRISGNLVE